MSEPAFHRLLLLLLRLLDRIRPQVQRQHQGADRHTHGDDRISLMPEEAIHYGKYYFDQIFNW